jgi:hypothetical protein
MLSSKYAFDCINLSQNILHPKGVISIFKALTVNEYLQKLYIGTGVSVLLHPEHITQMEACLEENHSLIEIDFYSPKLNFLIERNKNQVIKELLSLLHFHGKHRKLDKSVIKYELFPMIFE